MVLREVTRKEYMIHYNKLQRGSEDVDTTKYSDTYYALDNDAYVGVEYFKKGIVRVNGLFSLTRGSGMELLNTIIPTLKNSGNKVITLNCTKALKDKFYQAKNSPLFFQEVWSLVEVNYYELVLFL